MCSCSVEEDTPFVYDDFSLREKFRSVPCVDTHWYYTGALLLDKKSIEELLSAFSCAIYCSPDSVNGRKCRAVINRIFDLSHLNRCL